MGEMENEKWGDGKRDEWRIENGELRMEKRGDRNCAGVFGGDKSAVFSGSPTGSVGCEKLRKRRNHSCRAGSTRRAVLRRRVEPALLNMCI